MKHTIGCSAIWTVMILFILVLVPCTAFAYNMPDFDTINEQLEADAKAFHIPGMAVIVVNKDEVLFAEAYGNCESIDTPFIIGSMSKSFTALAIMQLVEQGKIDLDTPISDYIDVSLYLKNALDGNRITVRQLLNHTSGLGTYQRFGSAKITDSYGKYEYANVNYGLLGKIIESVSGKSYSDYVEQYIFSPLDMEHSSATFDNSKADGLIAGYRNYFGIPIAGEPDYPDDRSWSTVPAGYISSCASDMGNYLQMYLNNGSGIISQDSLDTMFYDNVPQDENNLYFYGMGWVLSNDFDEPVFNHSGLVENYTSNMFIFPESGIGIAVLVNMNDYLVGNNLINNIIMHLLGKEMTEASGNLYINYHTLLNLCYLLVILVAVFPILFIRRWRKKNHTKKQIVIDIFTHVILPIILLLLPYLVGVPLWVVWYFVKDLFFVLVVSAFLLLSTGIYKAFVVLGSKSTED